MMDDAWHLTPDMTIFDLNITVFVLYLTGLVLNITGYVLNTTLQQEANNYSFHFQQEASYNTERPWTKGQRQQLHSTREDAEQEGRDNSSLVTQEDTEQEARDNNSWFTKIAARFNNVNLCNQDAATLAYFSLGNQDCS